MRATISRWLAARRNKPSGTWLASLMPSRSRYGSSISCSCSFDRVSPVSGSSITSPAGIVMRSRKWLGNDTPLSGRPICWPSSMNSTASEIGMPRRWRSTTFR
ncbi:hypothetical protein D9M72_517460 [compost metagenome]